MNTIGLLILLPGVGALGFSNVHHHKSGGDHHQEPSKQVRIYFDLLKYGGPKAAHYQHSMIALGEGLAKMKVEFNSNFNYWNHLPDQPHTYLFNATAEPPSAFDAIVLPWERATEHHYHKDAHGPKLVLLDWSLGHDKLSMSSNANKYDLYYRAHNTKLDMPSTPKGPLQVSSFYMTDRMIRSGDEAAERLPSGTTRDFKLVWPHGKDPEHSVRRFMQDHFLKLLPKEFVIYTHSHKINESDPDYFYWSQTGRRHDHAFYETLQQAQVMDCTGGYFKKDSIYQWESFKLWEAFASGIACILPDLDKYGLQLPVMPEPFVHYVPAVLDEHSLIELSQKIQDGKIDFLSIGREGRAWAREHYSPEAFAKRFLHDLAS